MRNTIYSGSFFLIKNDLGVQFEPVPFEDGKRIQCNQINLKGTAGYINAKHSGLYTMGQAVTVYLRLMRYVVLEVPVNRVYVNAGYDGNWIKINDSTVSNFNWLSSMPQGERQNTNPGGWNPPDWGFDQTEDICESCTYSPPAD